MTDATVTQHGYAYDNDQPSARRHLSALARALDDFTIGRLHHLGLAGKRCLEIGAGGSEIAVWLAAQVGPAGSVTATDLKPRHIGSHPRLTVLRHDITTDPLPDGPFDLIHARLVLMHLPQREQLLAILAAALAPGGVLVIEDWHATADAVVLDAATDDDRDLFTAYQRAVNQRVFQAAGSDPQWALRLHQQMRRAGLHDVDTVINAPVWHSGSPGLILALTAIAEHRDRLRAAGLTDADLTRVERLLISSDAGLVVRGHQLYSVSGRKP
ncbi:methyltransferase domain-containing protein [Polymorphospora sp. NPDC051019]|uniref:methyltransferase domain-containing protein n=1 Tax=Polymorphospora sp. NPDC051019 TaxID=3155725 RepID=UPI0034364A6D